MKILSTLFVLVLATSTFGNTGKGGNITITTSASANQMVFQMQIIPENNIMVTLDGIDDEYGTVSIINSNGESKFFEFITDSKKEYFFNLNALEKGTYFVKLNANNEIRMKTIVVE